ncbi:hypothetical protein BI322_07690 [Klebsiella oxytoca]|nr:hypothetical protein BI322_07690 [Klebsiella oxytoca]
MIIHLFVPIFMKSFLMEERKNITLEKNPLMRQLMIFFMTISVQTKFLLEQIILEALVGLMLGLSDFRIGIHGYG